MRPISVLTSSLGLVIACTTGLRVAECQHLYGIHYETGVLYRISTTNAAVTPVGSTGIQLAAGLMLAPDGNLYSFDSATPIPCFYRIDPTTAATNIVSCISLGSFFFEGALTMDPSGSALAWGVGDAIVGNHLFRFDYLTGNVTHGPALSVDDDINGLEFRSDGLLVGIDRTSNSLVEIDPTTGAITSIAPISPTMGTVGGMAVSGGVGYFCTAGPTLGGSNELYSVNLFTGAIQLVGSLSPSITGGGIGGLAESPGSWFSYFCPGDGSTANCPCLNNGFPGNGCENSASTGGALLLATGTVRPDTVVLQATSELSSSLTIFLQGNATSLPGVIFGDGLRCTSGILKRLYVKNASGGMVSAPTGSDPSITARSAALGDPILPGERRYYQSYYRDANLSFCPDPPGSSFNITSGIKVIW